MPQPDSPLNRAIGLAGVIRWLIAVGAIIALGAAFADGHYALGTVGAVFMVGAVILGYRAWRARQAAGGAHSPLSPP